MAYIRCIMTTRLNARPRASRKPRRSPNEVLLALRCRRQDKADRVALQWRDGAGELHVEVLSPAQSWPYLN